VARRIERETRTRFATWPTYLQSRRSATCAQLIRRIRHIRCPLAEQLDSGRARFFGQVFHSAVTGNVVHHAVDAVYYNDAVEGIMVHISKHAQLER